MNPEELEALFGPAAPFSDHKRDETITFRVDGREQSGKILWVTPPGPAYEGGEDRPMTYWVDTGDGMPVPVYPGEVIE